MESERPRKIWDPRRKCHRPTSSGTQSTAPTTVDSPGPSWNTVYVSIVVHVVHGVADGAHFRKRTLKLYCAVTVPTFRTLAQMPSEYTCPSTA